MISKYGWLNNSPNYNDLLLITFIQLITIHMMHSIEWIGENWMHEFNFGTCLNPRAQRVGFRRFPKLNECIQFHWSTKYACASYVL